MRTRDGRMSLKSTSSVVSRDRISCTRAMERTRRSDSSRAWRASPKGQPAGLEAQQGRDGLQVVLHPVVDLADGGVLGQQQPVPAAQVGDVAQQHHRAGERPVVEQRDAADDDGHVRSPRTPPRWRAGASGKARSTTYWSRPASSRRMPAVPEVRPIRCRALTAFGRGVVDPGAGVEDQHPVADPRAARPGPRRPWGRELAGGDHPGQAVEDLDVDPLQLAGPTADRAAPTRGS